MTAVLAVVGVALRPLENPAWQAVKAKQPALRLESLQGALGQGVTVGLLGGFRAIVADFFWIKTNSVWEDRDLPATQTFIKLVTAIDPRPLYFWLNGARTLAYDIPHWRIAEAGGYNAVPEAEQRRFDREQAELALDMLHKAFGYHPDSPLLYAEIANVYLNRLKDREKAAEYYLKASKQPDAPFYVSRLYAEQLRRLGRKQEAYDWLKQLYVRLPKKPDPAKGITEWTVQGAMVPFVLDRIRELEAELEVPEASRFAP